MKHKIRRGMVVHSTSGLTLGTVMSTGPNSFTVEKGTFFPKEHELSYENIDEVRDDKLIYRLEVPEPVKEKMEAHPLRERLREKMGEREGWTTTELSEGEELRVPLMEEQVFVQKTTEETGQVRVHKVVVAEERQLTVPLMHEEVVVEHIPADKAVREPGERVFEEERYSIPLHAEAFRITKRPVLKEEVLVRRVTHEEPRGASATLRHEEIEIEDRSNGGKLETERRRRKEQRQQERRA